MHCAVLYSILEITYIAAELYSWLEKIHNYLIMAVSSENRNVYM